MSPFFYIILSLLFTNVILACIFLTAWRTMGRQKHTLIWAFAFIAGALQWLLNIFKPGQYELYWMLACALSVTTVIFGTWGHLERTKANFSPKVLFASSVTIIAITFYFTVISPHRGLSMSLYIFHTVFYLFVCSYVLLTHRKKPLPAEIGAACVYIIFAISQAVAATYALMQGAEKVPELYKVYATINFVSLPTAYIGMSLFIVFVLASDLAEKMRVQTITDPLTNCLNRRGFYDAAQQQISQLISKKQHVCLIYWDIDNFKTINDSYGHLAGDVVLQSITQQVFDNIKSSDLIGRLGGEEFVILLGRAEKQEAKDVANRLREIIAATPVVTEKADITVTASFGVTQITSENVKIETAIDTADKALYTAKRSGRNQVIEV